MSNSPSIWQYLRQSIGHAIRETGQALDRLAMKTIAIASTKNQYYDDPVLYNDHLSRHRQLLPMLTSGRPIIHTNVAFISPCTTVVGSVRIGSNTSIWYGTTIRADRVYNAKSYTIQNQIEKQQLQLQPKRKKRIPFSLDNNNNNNTPTITTQQDRNSSLVKVENEDNSSHECWEEEEEEPRPPAIDNDNRNILDDISYRRLMEIEQKNFGLLLRTAATRNDDDTKEDNNNSTTEDQYDDKKNDNNNNKQDNDDVGNTGGLVVIGDNTNIQDGCIITSNVGHTCIGNDVTVGHMAQIHSCIIEDECLIGMGSIISGPNTIIHTQSYIGAGTVIKPGTIIQSGEMWIGNPARKLRNLSIQEKQKLKYQSSEYVNVATEQRVVMKLGGNKSGATTSSSGSTSNSNEHDEDASRITSGSNKIVEQEEESLGTTAAATAKVTTDQTISNQQQTKSTTTTSILEEEKEPQQEQQQTIKVVTR